MVSGLIRNQLPGNRLRVRVSCPPLNANGSREIASMTRNHLGALGLLVVFLAIPLLGAEKKQGYLQDGELTQSLEIQELQGGFAGFTGTFTSIGKDGTWSVGPIGPRDKRGEPTAEGKLSAAQLRELADVLAKNKLNELPDHGKAVVNPQVVKIISGEKVVQWQGRNIEEGQDKEITPRYVAILGKVRALCQPPPKE